MPKKPRVRTLMDSQNVKGSERLLESEQQFFYTFFDHTERKSARQILF